MEIVVQHESKLVEVWLTRADQDNKDIQSRLKPLYADWKANKYRVSVFHSGEKSLPERISGLLLYNQGAASQQARIRTEDTNAAISRMKKR